MRRKIAAILPVYNTPDRAQDLIDHIARYVRHHDMDLIVVDDGSTVSIPQATVTLPANCGPIGARLMGMHYAKARERHSRERYFAYWHLAISASFPDPVDVLTPLIQALDDDPKLVCVQPAYTPDSETNWPHLITSGSGDLRPVWMIEYIAALYRADWFDAISWFDPELTWGWGTDLESSWLARRQEKRLAVHEGVLVRKGQNVGYRSGAYDQGFTASDRATLAHAEVNRRYTQKYGPDWNRLFHEDCVTLSDPLDQIAGGSS